MASWCTNRILQTRRLKGELVMYLCDDDYLLPEAFQTFWNYYSSRNREPQAMYSSQALEFLDDKGNITLRGRRFADRLAGSFCGGRPLNFQVDYLQFCHTARILEAFKEKYKTEEYFPEDRKYSGNADGVFMENIGALTTVYPIDKVLSVNRRTPKSINYPPTPYARFHAWLYFRKEALLHRLRILLKGRSDRTFSP
jgi:hypothetical protein